ncbi:hypothetical protein ALC62_10167 [Cyphomyrmex costatus]|uniref:Uncharacterized protein n=1 Tax=Cyphomyrmex costatus TaxID=456900 RepID=A0A195CG25_9HYME|nr:hypothetical protein ALC62_10167 [Cyphomyrmex costatus]
MVSRLAETGKPILSLHLRSPFAYVPILPSIRISASPRHPPPTCSAPPPFPNPIPPNCAVCSQQAAALRNFISCARLIIRRAFTYDAVAILLWVSVVHDFPGLRTIHSKNHYGPDQRFVWHRVSEDAIEGNYGGCNRRQLCVTENVRVSSSHMTIAISNFVTPRAVVIRAANQKLSSEQPTGCPSMQQAATSAHSLKRGWTVGKYKRNRYTGRRGWDEWEDVRNVLGGCWSVVSFVDVSSSFCSVAHTCVYTNVVHLTWRTTQGRAEKST